MQYVAAEGSEVDTAHEGLCLFMSLACKTVCECHAPHFLAARVAREPSGADPAAIPHRVAGLRYSSVEAAGDGGE